MSLVQRIHQAAANRGFACTARWRPSTGAAMVQAVVLVERSDALVSDGYAIAGKYAMRFAAEVLDGIAMNEVVTLEAGVECHVAAGDYQLTEPPKRISAEEMIVGISPHGD